MNFYCYILFSKTTNTFYVGSTSLPIEERLNQHNSSFYGNKKYTHKAVDWEIFHLILCRSKKQAHLIELHIKSMKSSRYILNLKLYPEIQNKLLIKYE